MNIEVAEITIRVLHNKSISLKMVNLFKFPWTYFLLEKLTGRQLNIKFHAIFGTRRFINALTRHPTRTPMDRTLGQLHQVNTFKPRSLNTQFNVTLRHTLQFPRCHLTFSFSEHNFLRIPINVIKIKS